MKICLYSPYVPEHTGGGEKYLFDVAKILATKHQVSIAIPAQKFNPQANDESHFLQSCKEVYQRFFEDDLVGIEFILSPLGTSQSAWQKLRWTAQFDVMYYATDGSFFFSGARKNIAHIQVPLILNKTSVFERLKLANWSVKNTNSEFTKEVVERTWPTHINFVHHPMVEAPPLKAIKKEKIILNVGRFFRQLHSKRQDILVEAFRALFKADPTLLKGWKLVLIGGVEDQEYAQEIAALAKKLPVEIYHQVNRQELWQWYQKASIYWHATGFGIDETTEPEKVEHFGISTVEAMVAGAVPVVIGKGGQLEVVGAELKPYTWTTIDECLTQTKRVIEDEKLRLHLSKVAQDQATHFDKKTFANILWQMVEGAHA